jgi:hypothetical protein
LNEELGQTLSAYPEIEAEKRKVDSSFTIPRIVLMIDEYKAWMTLFESDALANAKKDDGIVAKIATLLRAARSYKFTIILSSQEFKADTFPPTMKAQTGNKLVHTVTSKQEAEYMGADFDKIKTFNPGDFILMSQGKFCKYTKNSNITARLNYIGDIPAIYRYLETKECAKNGKDFEKHFLYSSGAGETEISKASDAKLVAMIRDVLFVREGWDIKEENDSDSYLPLVFSKGDRELAVGIIKKNEASDEDIVEKIKAEFPQGLDAVLDYVGPTTFDKSFALLRNNGRIMFCGMITGREVNLNIQQTYFRHLNINGLFLGSPNNMTDLLELLEKGEIEPQVDSEFDISNAKEAQENFRVNRVDVFTVDGRPGAGAVRIADLVTCDWGAGSAAEKVPGGDRTGRDADLLCARLSSLWPLQLHGHAI